MSGFIAFYLEETRRSFEVRFNEHFRSYILKEQIQFLQTLAGKQIMRSQIKIIQNYYLSKKTVKYWIS